MWFPLSLLAMSMLVLRRTTEKQLVSKVDALSMAWLQQTVALPFIILSLVIAPFFLPSELSWNFWFWTGFYAIAGAIDLMSYFAALALADLSYIAPMLSLVSVGNVLGAYVILGQKPTWYGMLGAVAIVVGAVIIHRARRKSHIGDESRRKAHAAALGFVLVLVVIRAIYANTEVFALREANPTTFNFYSSMLTVPLILLTVLAIRKYRGLDNPRVYFQNTATMVKANLLAFAFIGVTYMINLTATYQAKLIGPNAGYVTAVKAAQVLPMVIIGVLFFKEKITKAEVAGLGIIMLGMVALGVN